MTLKTLASVSTIALVAAGAANAGGFDRSGQGIGVIFEEGTYGEFSIGRVMPKVSGTLAAPNPALSSGNIGVDYTQVGFGFKADVSDQFSIALIVDQPFGANVNYGNTAAGYPLSGASAEVESTALTLLGRYKFAWRYTVVCDTQPSMGKYVVFRILRLVRGKLTMQTMPLTQILVLL